MNKEYKKILDGLKKENQSQLNVNDRVLIIDSLNTFLRSFVVIKHFNSNLNHIGGLTGFLKSLGHAIRVVRPTRVILVFDGKGGSTNKRYLYPEYKANRGISRVTNWDNFESQEEESEAITNQILRLVHYLKCLPVDLISIDKIEADDVIGYISNILPKEVTIMSSDKDFLQLVSNKITVYSPIKKKFYNEELVLKEYGVTPRNFLMQKVLLGDSGDNVPGIKGLGPKTLIKLYPELSTEKKVSLQEIVDKAKQCEGKKYSEITSFKHQLYINEKLMDLHNPNIPEESKKDIEYTLNNPYKEFNPKIFSSLYEEDGLGESIPNLQFWLYNNFNELQKYI